MSEDFYRMQLAQLQANLDAARQMRSTAESEFQRLAALVEEIAQSLLAPELDAYLAHHGELAPDELARWVIREGRARLHRDELLLAGDLPNRLSAAQMRIAELEAELSECLGLKEQVGQLKAQLSRLTDEGNGDVAGDEVARRRAIEDAVKALVQAGLGSVTVQPEPVSVPSGQCFAPDLEAETGGERIPMLVETRRSLRNPSRRECWAAGAQLFGRLDFVVPSIYDQEALLQGISRWAYDEGCPAPSVSVRVCCLASLDGSGRLWHVEREFKARGS